MQSIQTWLPIAIVPVVGLVQWWVMRASQRKHLEAARARHRQAEQAAAKLLQQARQQAAQLQQELAAARLQAKRVTQPAPPTPPRAAEVTESLLAMLNEAQPRRASLPADGFADTLPSLQFPHASRL